MASSRAASPMSDSGRTSSPQLTPNSKVKALLASLDKESDDESVSGSARARLVSSLVKDSDSTARVGGPTMEENARTSRQATETASEDDEEDEEEIVKPRGRLAAAMRAPEVEREDSPATDNARDRVKKSLMARSEISTQATSSKDASSEESDAPVISRKRKVRTSRSVTPISSPEKAPASPGLFVSPTSHRPAAPSDVSDEDELPANPSKNNRFKALVEKKRQENLAKEQEAFEQKAKIAAERQRHSDILEDDVETDGSDDNAGRRLTQQARPTRKASKKALEEMHRETQRLSRNQQLAHNATTKKKFTTAEFMARFKFRTASENPSETASRPLTSSSVDHSDTEMKDTPPTSPASHDNDNLKSNTVPELPALQRTEDDAQLPMLENALLHIPSSPPKNLDKGKGKAIEQPIQAEMPKAPVFKQRRVQVRPPKLADRKSSPLDESDSDLEIVNVQTPKLKKKLDSIFDRVPAKQARESHSLHALRLLAHLTSPGKQHLGKNKQSSMTTSELQMSLQQRARQQAAREREEKLQELRNKGIVVQTAEERQQEMAEFEDLLAKARRETEKITKEENAAAKRERKERGEADPLSGSSDDEDWQEDKENLPAEHSASGSDDEAGSGSDDGDASGEDEDDDEMELDDEADNEAAANSVFDNEAAESDEDGLEVDQGLADDGQIIDDGDVEEEEEEEDETHTRQKARKSRNFKVISDDEDAEAEEDQRTPMVKTTTDVSPGHLNAPSPMAPNSVLRSATKTFIPGVTVIGPVGLGLTQIFAGTMDDSQIADCSISPASQPVELEQDRMAFLRRLPPPQLPPFMPTMEEDTQETIANNQSQTSHIPESQPVEDETQGVQLNFIQSQVHGFDSLVDSQMSPFPDATQDVGFQHMTPIRGRFVDAPPSTIDTLVADPSAGLAAMEGSPILKKKGKLRRRAPAVAFSDDEEAAVPVDLGQEDFDIDNVFDVMRKASKKTKPVLEDFDKKNSKAKDMVHEQADESEDEYAGLGGASDDESGGEADEFVKAMIDDEGGKDADASKLAAFYADRERANDEKNVEKLFKDITNGMLRRKRGADYDLSDSDDGGEARRRMKRKEFAKMRKALLSDERLGKIAENPKRQAFLRAIEDRGSEEEMDFLDDFQEQEEEDSQSQSQATGSQQVVPNSQPTEMAPPKRKQADDSQEGYVRLPPHLRRTQPSKKPSNISEIRESLSSLIDEPNAIVAAADSGSESEDDLEIEGDDDLGTRKEKEKENRNPFALRRSQNSVVDRISLKRAGSSTVSNTTRLAFAASSMAPGFKVPALLRRATTNSSLASTTSSSVSGAMSATERTAGASKSEGVKRGGGKNSGVNYFARESERRAAVVKTEARREKKLFKGAEVRRKIVGGLFGAGKFE